jgi:hypothetical protein
LCSYEFANDAGKDCYTGYYAWSVSSLFMRTAALLHMTVSAYLVNMTTFAKSATLSFEKVS